MREAFSIISHEWPMGDHGFRMRPWFPVIHQVARQGYAVVSRDFRWRFLEGMELVERVERVELWLWNIRHLSGPVAAENCRNSGSTSPWFGDEDGPGVGFFCTEQTWL